MNIELSLLSIQKRLTLYWILVIITGYHNHKIKVIRQDRLKLKLEQYQNRTI